MLEPNWRVRHTPGPTTSKISLGPPVYNNVRHQIASTLATLLLWTSLLGAKDGTPSRSHSGTLAGVPDQEDVPGRDDPAPHQRTQPGVHQGRDTPSTGDCNPSMMEDTPTPQRRTSPSTTDPEDEGQDTKKSLTGSWRRSRCGDAPDPTKLRHRLRKLLPAPSLPMPVYRHYRDGPGSAKLLQALCYLSVVILPDSIQPMLDRPRGSHSPRATKQNVHAGIHPGGCFQLP